MERIKNSAYKILRKSENYTKTDMVTLAKESSWLSFGKFTNIISSVLLTYILANFLPQDVFGQYKFVISMFGIIAAFSLTGIGTALTQVVARGYEKTFFEAIKIHLRWSLVMTLISLVLSIYYFLNNNYVLGISMLLVAIASPIMQTYTMYSPYLQGKRNFRDDSWYGFWYSIVPAIILSIVAITSNSFLLIIATYFITYSLISLLINSKVAKTVDKNTQIDYSAISYGKHLSLMNVLGGISTHIDKILMFHFLGAVQLAIYTIAIAIPQQLRTFDRLITSISATRLPNLSIEQIKKVLPRKAFIIFLISLLIAIIYVFVAPLFFKILFPEYLDSIFYSQIYVLIMLFSPVILLKQTLTAHMRKKELYLMQTVMPITKILALFLLLPNFGILGALYSIFISEMIRLIMIIYFYKKLS